MDIPDVSLNKIPLAQPERIAEAPPVSVGAKRTAGDEQATRNDKAAATVDVSAKDAEKIALEIQRHLERLDTKLKLEVDNRSKQVIVKFIDPVTNDVVRQVPSEELMAIRERMEEFIGVLYKGKM